MTYLNGRRILTILMASSLLFGCQTLDEAQTTENAEKKLAG